MRSTFFRLLLPVSDLNAVAVQKACLCWHGRRYFLFRNRFSQNKSAPTPFTKPKFYSSLECSFASRREEPLRLGLSAQNLLRRRSFLLGAQMPQSDVLVEMLIMLIQNELKKLKSSQNNTLPDVQDVQALK